MATIYRVISEHDIGLEDEAFPSEEMAIAYMQTDETVREVLTEIEIDNVLEALQCGAIQFMEMNLHE